MARLSITDAAFLADPGAATAPLRAAGPLHRTRMPLVGEVWLTTTDAAAREVLTGAAFVRAPESVGRPPLSRRFGWLPARIRPLLDTIIQTDGETHDRLRGAVVRAFALHAVEAIEPALRDDAASLLGALPAGRPVDLIPGYTRPLPFTAICRLLGLPEPLWPALRRGIAPLSAAQGWGGTVLGLFRIGGALRLLEEEAARQRRAPGPGLIGRMHAEGTLTPREIATMSTTLFMAGHETTVHLIDLALWTLLADPDARAAWESRPEARGLWIEEALRLHSPVTMTKLHYARPGATIQGVPVPEGAQVAALLVAGNHDPDRHVDPGTFRPDRRPNAHLAFGLGAHACLGMQLARLETRVALETLLDRYPGTVLDGPVTMARRPGLRGPGRLYVRLRR
ncbi:MAG: cytochrome P450 [Shimia sp.]